MFWSQFKSTKKAVKKLPMSAKAVLITRNRKVLILQKPCGKFDLPGGKVERGEDLYGALAREIMEECGIKVKKFDFIASWVRENRDMLQPRLMLVFRGYLPRKSEQTSLMLSQEHRWGGFLAPKKALRLNMDIGYKNAVATSLNHRLHI